MWPAAEHRRSRAPRWRSAGAGRSAATGARLGRDLVQKDERNTCAPLGPRAWAGDGWSMGLGGGDGAAATGSPESVVPAVPGPNSKR